jgi:hypothetical protein
VSVPQTGERARAVGPGERSVRGFLGHANIWASAVSQQWAPFHRYRTTDWVAEQLGGNPA